MHEYVPPPSNAPIGNLNRSNQPCVLQKICIFSWRPPVTMTLLWTSGWDINHVACPADFPGILSEDW